MRKIYSLLGILFLSVVLMIGVVALFHSDETASKPKLSLAGLLNGNFSAQCQNAYRDTFPETKQLKNWNTKLNGFYRSSALAGEDDVQLIINMSSSAADGGESLEDHGQQPKPSTAPDASGPEKIPEESHNGAGAGADPNAVVENLGAALIVGNRAIEVPYADYDSIENYAGTVTAIATALGSGVRTFNIAVPNAAEFYTTEDYHSGSSSQIDMIDFCYDHLGSNVKSVDAYTKLADHVDEYIYFRTDHHWTQLGSYYAYTAFCEEAGFTAPPLSKFEQGQYDAFVGSMYYYLSDYPQSKILKDEPDTLYYYRPFVEIDTNYYMDASLDMAYGIGTISYVGEDTSNKYLCFLGGDHPVTIIETDVEGPVCMLIKESYGNAFAPWLTSHYSKVIVIDPREFNRDGKPSLDLAAFAAEQGVDDCIVLNYPMMLSSDAYIDWLGRLVK